MTKDKKPISNNKPLFERYSLLDAFRGLAIIWIVLFHILDRHFYGNFASSVLNNGHLGVQIFLVISGYTIAAALERAVVANESAFHFFLKRCKRIYTTYWFSLIFAALIIPSATGLVSSLKSHHLVFEFFHYSMYEWIQIITLLKIFSAQNSYLNKLFLPLNGVVWFIAILVQIYFVVSFCLFFGKKYKWALSGLFIITSLLTMFPNAIMLPYRLFFPYFPEFFVGMISFHLVKNNSFQEKNRLYFIYLAIFFTFAAILIKYFLSPFIFSVLVGTLFYLLYPLQTELLRFRIYKIFIFIGSFSYSLYLLHIPLWQFVAMFIRNLVPLPDYVSTPFILIPCVIFISFVWYLFFEKPSSFRNIYIALKNPFKTLVFNKTYFNTH